MRIPWVQLEPMFFIFGALERILRMHDASNASPHQVSRHVIQECRQWQRDLKQAIELAYSFWSTVPMVAHAILPLKLAMDSSRQRETGTGIDSGNCSFAIATQPDDLAPADHLQQGQHGQQMQQKQEQQQATLPMLEPSTEKAEQPAEKSKRKAESTLDPTGAQLVALRQKVPLDSSALSDTVQPMYTDEASATRIAAAVVWFPKMFAALRYCFVGATYDEEMAGLLVTSGCTSCAFVGSNNDELLGVGIADTDRNHICYVAAWGMPGRAVSETIAKLLRPGNITLYDGTNSDNEEFWPGLGFEVDADLTRNPSQSPKQMIASQDEVLAKIDEIWRRSKKRWVEGTDFRVLTFALTKTDIQSLHHRVFGCDMPDRRGATTQRVAAARAAAEMYGNHLTKKWLLKGLHAKYSADSKPYATWFLSHYVVDDPRMFDGSIKDCKGKAHEFRLQRSTIVDSYRQFLRAKGKRQPIIRTPHNFWKEIKAVLPAPPVVMGDRECKYQGVDGLQGVWQRDSFEQLVAAAADDL